MPKMSPAAANTLKQDIKAIVTDACPMIEQMISGKTERIIIGMANIARNRLRESVSV
jgi:hypothetical protein